MVLPDKQATPSQDPADSWWLQTALSSPGDLSSLLPEISFLGQKMEQETLQKRRDVRSVG